MAWKTQDFQRAFAEWARRDHPDIELQAEVLIALDRVIADPVGSARVTQPTEWPGIDQCGVRLARRVLLIYYNDHTQELAVAHEIVSA